MAGRLRGEYGADYLRWGRITIRSQPLSRLFSRRPTGVYLAERASKRRTSSWCSHTCITETTHILDRRFPPLHGTGLLEHQVDVRPLLLIFAQHGCCRDKEIVSAPCPTDRSVLPFLPMSLFNLSEKTGWLGNL